MATLIRSAKSGSDWSSNELLAFNIQIVTTDARTFFGSDQLPDITVPQVILDNANEPLGLTVKSEIDFFQYLEEAVFMSPEEESSVHDFTAFLLKMMKYDEGRRMVRTRKEMEFEMCGQRVSAKADVCVADPSNLGGRLLLLVQEDKHYLHQGDPEPQLIAEAVAAFYLNNLTSRMVRLPMIDSRMVPGIVMKGVSPTFYKIPVTEQLLTSIITGQYPTEPTIVQRFIPPVPDPWTLLRHGMRLLDNRRVCLQCFEAFRKFVV